MCRAPHTLIELQGWIADPGSPRRPARSLPSALVLATVLALLLPCGCGPRVATRANGPAQVGPGAHVVQSAELREVMRGLRDIRYDRLPPEIDARQERRRHLREIGLQAARMADAARGIPAAAVESDLTEEEQRTFASLARQLGAQAGELRDAAWRGQENEVREIWKTLTATCDACHAEFRVGALADLP